MRRYGIVNHCTYAFISKILLQPITLLTKNRKDMPNAFSLFRKTNQRINDVVNITSCYLLAAKIIFIKIFKLDA